MVGPAGANAENRLKATCRLANRSVGEFVVLDISAAGCMVERRAWTLKAEDRLLIKLPGLEYQTASVVWCDDENAGIAFENLLYEPVLLRLREMMQGRAQAA